MQRMFNIRFHAGSRIENGPFVGGCPGRPAVMNDARPAISNATTALFPSGVNPAGNSATEYRTREDSEAASPATKLLRRGFLLSDLPSSPAGLPSRSCTRYACLGCLGETITPTTHKARAGIASEEIYIPTLDIPGRLSRKIRGRASYVSFSREMSASSPRENKYAYAACVAFFLN